MQFLFFAVILTKHKTYLRCIYFTGPCNMQKKNPSKINFHCMSKLDLIFGYTRKIMINNSATQKSSITSYSWCLLLLLHCTLTTFILQALALATVSQQPTTAAKQGNKRWLQSILSIVPLNCLFQFVFVAVFFLVFFYFITNSHPSIQPVSQPTIVFPCCSLSLYFTWWTLRTEQLSCQKFFFGFVVS